MQLQDVYLFQDRSGFVRGDLTMEDGRIKEVHLTGGAPNRECPAPVRPDRDNNCLLPDPDGTYVLPGLVDIHTHGNSGCDFSDGDPDGLRVMAEYYGRRGITSFLPTSMTLPYEVLERAFRTAAEYLAAYEKDPSLAASGAAAVSGIHMEGPFLASAKSGAQNAAYLQRPDCAAFQKLQDACGGLIRIVDIAPELEGAMDFVRQASWTCRVSIAHTDASYEETAAVLDAGASHMTHLFNAMPWIHHRRPGVIGAAFERSHVTAELICDGIHIHPAIVRMAFQLFPGRICLVSDSLRCCGMPEGEYELGGQKVVLRDRAARLPDGTLAGAASDLFEDMCNAIRFGIPYQEAILAATMNPARVIGAEEEIGSIAPGKRADLVVCDSSLRRKEVYIRGRRVRA